MVAIKSDTILDNTRIAYLIITQIVLKVVCSDLWTCWYDNHFSIIEEVTLLLRTINFYLFYIKNNTNEVADDY